MAPIYLGIFLIAGSILLLEIALTRVFAIMMWHHLTYMAVSIAMLGFGAAGSILTARGAGTDERRPDRTLALFSCLYGLSVTLMFMAVTRVPMDTLAIWQNKWNFASLGLIYLLVFTPFLFGGVVVGLALSRFADRVNRLYFFDLVGSAAGGISSVWLLSVLGSSATVVTAGAVGVAAGVCFSVPLGRRALAAASSALVVAVLAAISFAGGAPGIPATSWPVPFAPGKEFARYEDPSDITRLHSATAEVEIGPDEELLPIIGGNFGAANLRKIEGRHVGQDGTAPTMLYQGAADLEQFGFLRDSQTASAHVAFEARDEQRSPRVLVIGVGGGVDVMVALAYDADPVTAVEINPAMIEMVTEHFDDYLDGLFRPDAHAYSDRIELVLGEGRSFARSRGEAQYDVIQMSGVDSFTALSTGAYTLSESYLYTVEAVQEFFGRLAPSGYINYSRFILQRPKKPRETLRLANIALVALAEMGVEKPAEHIAVFQGRNWASTLIKESPFVEAEIYALQEFASEQGFWGLVYDPLHEPGTRFEPSPRHELDLKRRFERAAEDGVLSLFAYHRDDPWKPVINALRFELSGEPDKASVVLARLCAELPGSLRERALAAIDALIDPLVERVTSSHASFQLSRQDFEALMRGDDRDAFVADYEYDLSPSTDDAPFFFNYYRYASLLEPAAARGGSTEIYHPDYPVGHMVLLASLAQITLLGGLLILLPLRSLSRDGIATPHRWRVFGYFAALGAGFMLAEIVLMQRMVLFLGHPTYAVSVVLTSLLAFAGLGSLLAGRIQLLQRPTFVIILAGILAMITTEGLATAFLLPQLLGAPFPAKVALIVGLLAPLGLILGMPFPLGIRVLKQHCPQLLPWAWAINGFLSVFSSIFCILMGMAVGFSWVLAFAAFTYAGGFLLLISTPHLAAHAEAGT